MEQIHKDMEHLGRLKAKMDFIKIILDMKMSDKEKLERIEGSIE